MSPWQEVTLEALIEHRRAGVTDFEDAWARAQRRCKARGCPRPRDFSGNAVVKDDPGWLPFTAFWRRALEREWTGVSTTDFAGLAELLDHDGAGRTRAHDRVLG